MRTSCLQRGRVGENNFDDVFECLGRGTRRNTAKRVWSPFLFFELDGCGSDHEKSSGSNCKDIS